MKTARRAVRFGGFTLIEMLVVIVIMLIVMALMLPTLARMLSRSRRMVCISNTRQLAFAWFCYAGEHNNQIVSANTGGGCWVDNGNDTTALTNGLLWPYLKEVKIYKCPGSRVNVPDVIRDQNRSVSLSGYMNGEGSKTETLSGILSLTRTLTFIEEYDNRGYLINSFAWGGPGSWVDTVGVFHDNGDNYGFADGHAEFRAYNNPGFLITVRGTHYVGVPANDPDCNWVDAHIWPTRY